MKLKIIYTKLFLFFFNSSSPDHRCCNYEQKIKIITTEATSVTTLATSTTAESKPITTTLKPRPTTTRTSTRVPTTRTTTRVPTTRTTTTRTRTTTRKALPVKANSVKVGDPPIVVKGLVVDEFG